MGLVGDSRVSLSYYTYGTTLILHCRVIVGSLYPILKGCRDVTDKDVKQWAMPTQSSAAQRTQGNNEEAGERADVAE